MSSEQQIQRWILGDEEYVQILFDKWFDFYYETPPYDGYYKASASRECLKYLVKLENEIVDVIGLAEFNKKLWARGKDEYEIYVANFPMRKYDVGKRINGDGQYRPWRMNGYYENGL